MLCIVNHSLNKVELNEYIALLLDNIRMYFISKTNPCLLFPLLKALNTQQLSHTKISLYLIQKVFPGYKFYPLAQLSENVPILTCGGISKGYVIRFSLVEKKHFNLVVIYYRSEEWSIIQGVILKQKYTARI